MAADPIRIEGMDQALASFKNLDRELRKNANGELRQASKAIAVGIKPLLGGSGSPQEAKILAAAGPKSDRYVVLAVPNRKPSLSGLKKSPAAMAKRIGFALEGGSHEKQFHGPAVGSLVGKHQAQIERYAVPKYTQALWSILRKYGLA